MRVLGSTMGYDTNPPPPVAVTMLGPELLAFDA